MRRPRAFFLLAVLSAGCSQPPATTSEAQPQASDPFGGYEWVDLTHAYDRETVYWPTGIPFDHIETAFGVNEKGYFYSSFDLKTSEHSGTHLDAPIHFAQGRKAVDELAVEELIGPAVVLDVSASTAADPDYRLSTEDIQAAETAAGEIPAGAIVLVRTGWSERWPDRLAYMGDDTPGSAANLHFPGIAPEAAEVLVERGVKAVGIDTASIDHGPSTEFQTHRILNGAGISGLENLTHLDRLPARGAQLVALPMKIAGGSGGPCRVVALVPRGPLQ